MRDTSIWPYYSKMLRPFVNSVHYVRLVVNCWFSLALVRKSFEILLSKTLQYISQVCEFSVENSPDRMQVYTDTKIQKLHVLLLEALLYHCSKI